MGVFDAPESILALRRYLLSIGFALAYDLSGGMGGTEQIYAGSLAATELAIRITSDRGHWLVELKTGTRSLWPRMAASYGRPRHRRDIRLIATIGWPRTRLWSHIRVNHSTAS